MQDVEEVITEIFIYRTSCAFCYYGVVLMTTELFEAKGNLCSLSGTEGIYTCSADCRPLSSEDYLDLLWTTLAEFPGNISVGIVSKLLEVFQLILFPYIYLFIYPFFCLMV